MILSTTVREAIYNALVGLTYEGEEIPIFDEIVNPGADLAAIGGATVYVLIQDQEESKESQNTCSSNYNCRVTIRVVTIFERVGNKRLSEEIRGLIFDRLTNNRGQSKLSGINSVNLEVSRNIVEYTERRLSYSSILIMGFKINV